MLSAISLEGLHLTGLTFLPLALRVIHLLPPGEEYRTEAIVMSLVTGRKSLAESKLTPYHEQAARLLSEGFSGNQVAAKLGFRPATISKWVRHWPAFQDELGELQSISWASSAAIEGKASHAGLILFARVIADERANTRDRLSAVATVLNHQRSLAEIDIRIRQVRDLEERLASIERRQQQVIDVESSPARQLQSDA